MHMFCLFLTLLLLIRFTWRAKYIHLFQSPSHGSHSYSVAQPKCWIIAVPLGAIIEMEKSQSCNFTGFYQKKKIQTENCGSAPSDMLLYSQRVNYDSQGSGKCFLEDKITIYRLWFRCLAACFWWFNFMQLTLMND